MTAAVSLIQSSHAVFYGFSTLSWTAAGLDGRVIGVLWALMVVAEIIVFAVSGGFPPASARSVLLGLGAAGAVVRWTVMALDPPVVLLPLVQGLHGAFVRRDASRLGVSSWPATAPSGLGATAQGYFTLALGLVMAAAMALSGWLYEAYGHARLCGDGARSRRRRSAGDRCPPGGGQQARCVILQTAADEPRSRHAPMRQVITPP